MHTTEATPSLDYGLQSPAVPVNVRFRNFIASRTLLLGELLGGCHTSNGFDYSPDMIGIPVVAGRRRGRLGGGASRAVCDAVASAGHHAGLSLPVLSAMATHMLSSLLPSLGQIFEQDGHVRVENAEGGCPDTYRWAKFA